MRILLLSALLASAPAHALTTDRDGVWIQATGGLGLDVPDIGFGPSWHLGGGYWWGRYDREYALGRYWGLGATVRQDFVDGALRTVPTVELRRGNDIIVVGTHWFVGAGPRVGVGAVGAEVRVGAGAKFRFTPEFGALVRIEASGVYEAGAPGAQVGLVIGPTWSSPLDRGD